MSYQAEDFGKIYHKRRISQVRRIKWRVVRYGSVVCPSPV